MVSLQNSYGGRKSSCVESRPSLNIIGPEHPFFEKPLTRYLTVAVCVSWSVMEWVFGDPFWGVLTTGLAGLAAWQLILDYKPKTVTAEKQNDSNAKP